MSMSRNLEVYRILWKYNIQCIKCELNVLEHETTTC